mmetsp:Transcript_30233/g.29546  ORF Transcript_30233/g.29546 Transcript_30233/m.29546 type:complete len:227 (-) Transcript_30233:645-1325(-)
MFFCDSLKYSASAYALTAVTPAAPQLLKQSSTLIYTDQLVIEWQATADNGGSPIAAYHLDIQYITAATSAAVTLSSAARSYTLTGLTPGHEYQIRIQCENLVGTSDWTDYITTYAGIQPTNPGLITFLASTRNSLDLQWSLLTGSDTGGTTLNPITMTAYDIYMDNGLGGDFYLVSSVAGNSDTISFLTPGLMYRFFLKATNNIALTSSASPIQSMMAGTTPSGPS